MSGAVCAGLPSTFPSSCPSAFRCWPPSFRPSSGSGNVATTSWNLNDLLSACWVHAMSCLFVCLFVNVWLLPGSVSGCLFVDVWLLLPGSVGGCLLVDVWLLPESVAGCLFVDVWKCGWVGVCLGLVIAWKCGWVFVDVWLLPGSVGEWVFV